jgi:PLP dependent protein
LMTMPPLLDDPERVRPYFVRLVRLRNFIAAEIPGLDLRELSMGTSADYEIGVQEGATLVRVGTAILGPRIYRSEDQPST